MSGRRGAGPGGAERSAGRRRSRGRAAGAERAAPAVPARLGHGGGTAGTPQRHRRYLNRGDTAAAEAPRGHGERRVLGTARYSPGCPNASPHPAACPAPPVTFSGDLRKNCARLVLLGDKFFWGRRRRRAAVTLEACWNRWLFWQKARRSLRTAILRRDGATGGRGKALVARRARAASPLKASPLLQRSFTLPCPSLCLALPLPRHICWEKMR